MSDTTPKAPQGEFVLFAAADGKARVECRFEQETLWLTQAQLAELYQKSVATINEHLANIYQEGEIDQNATIRKFRIVRTEGSRQVTRGIDQNSTCKSYLQVAQEGNRQVAHNRI